MKGAIIEDVRKGTAHQKKIGELKVGVKKPVYRRHDNTTWAGFTQNQHVPVREGLDGDNPVWIATGNIQSPNMDEVVEVLQDGES